MTTWQTILKGEHREPRLWVETVWLLESTEPLTITREIQLKRGVNIIWAQPASGSGPLQMSRSGHGVGKSAFCQLLRFLLLDRDWANENLKDELRYHFAGGGVAARVHILGEDWTVYLPYVHQQTRRALRDTGLADIFAEDVGNEFEAYRHALQVRLIETLPVKQLPTDGQQIEWQHILPWCIRDQGSRLTDFFRWRSGKGIHLQLPAKSPPVLVKIVLGVLEDITAHTEATRHDAEVARLKRKLEEAKRKPEFLKAHAEEALRRLLGLVSDTPFFRRDLLDTGQPIEERARLEQQNLDAEEIRIQSRVDQNERQTAAVHSRWRDAWRGRVWPRHHYLTQRATLSNSSEALARLEQQRQELLSPSSDCPIIGMPLAQCAYVLERAKTPAIAMAAQARSHSLEMDTARRALPGLREQYKSALLTLLPIRRERQCLRQERKDLLRSLVEARTRRQRIAETREDHRRQCELLGGKVERSEQMEISEKLGKAEASRDSAKMKLKLQEETITARAHQLTEIANRLAQAVFDDDEAFARFMPASDRHLFELGPRKADAFDVLEILIADIACLLDACRQQSHYPGLLVHDSPCEAELSHEVFYRLMEVVVEIASEWKGSAPFQYVVTTTHTSLPESIRSALCIPPLGGQGPQSYLFRRDLMVAPDLPNRMRGVS